jgi:hypothetical protein
MENILHREMHSRYLSASHHYKRIGGDSPSCLKTAGELFIALLGCARRAILIFFRGANYRDFTGAMAPLKSEGLR